MMDIVTYCDVNTCEDCPRYGDDCDGDKRVEHTDYISRADAIEAVMAEGRKVYTSEYANAERIIYEEDAVEALAMLPSADAVQGEWVDEDGNNVPLHKDGYPLRSCYCNQCHEWLVASDEYEVKGNFCPNCGARMKGGAE